MTQVAPVVFAWVALLTEAPPPFHLLAETATKTLCGADPSPQPYYLKHHPWHTDACEDCNTILAAAPFDLVVVRDPCLVGGAATCRWADD